MILNLTNWQITILSQTDLSKNPTTHVASNRLAVCCIIRTKKTVNPEAMLHVWIIVVTNKRIFSADCTQDKRTTMQNLIPKEIHHSRFISSRVSRILQERKTVGRVSPKCSGQCSRRVLFGFVRELQIGRVIQAPSLLFCLAPRRQKPAATVRSGKSRFRERGTADRGQIASAKKRVSVECCLHTLSDTARRGRLASKQRR